MGPQKTYPKKKLNSRSLIAQTWVNPRKLLSCENNTTIYNSLFLKNGLYDFVYMYATTVYGYKLRIGHGGCVRSILEILEIVWEMFGWHARWLEFCMKHLGLARLKKSHAVRVLGYEFYDLLWYVWVWKHTGFGKVLQSEFEILKLYHEFNDGVRWNHVLVWVRLSGEIKVSVVVCLYVGCTGFETCRRWSPFA